MRKRASSPGASERSRHERPGPTPRRTIDSGVFASRFGRGARRCGASFRGRAARCARPRRAPWRLDRPYPRQARLPGARWRGSSAKPSCSTVLLATSLKIDGRFQLQTRSDGAIDMLVVDFDAPDRLRALARFDARKLEPRRAGEDLLGKGHLALTIDPGNEHVALPRNRRLARAGAGGGRASIFPTSPSKYRRACVSRSRKT